MGSLSRVFNYRKTQKLVSFPSAPPFWSLGPKNLRSGSDKVLLHRSVPSSMEGLLNISVAPSSILVALTPLVGD